MYKTFVPIQTATLERYDREKYVHFLHDLGAETVFLCPDGGIGFWDNYEKELASLQKQVDYMHRQGFTVGVWVWTFMFSKKSDYTYMVNPLGKVSSGNVCPTDKAYRKRMGGFVQDAAKIGVDLFMFDDDYRYGFIDIGFGCLCQNHLKMIGDELGETVDIPKMEKYLLHGAPNKYRTAFLHANGKALEDFAADMRSYINEINPDIRMGFCSCITSWDIDGTTPTRIAKLLAGNTKPFYRLIGAPYWAAGRHWGNRLSYVIDMERIEASFEADKDIDMFAEGDTFPRPRTAVPAAYLEGFDMALQVAGCLNGILKYAVDYNSMPDYETGYVRAHNKNKHLYSEIKAMFGDKSPVGIRVYSKPDRYADVTVLPKMEGKTDIQDYDFYYTSRFLCGTCLPGVHEGLGVTGIAMGEDIKAVPKEAYQNGLILDLAAAQYLQNNGVDVGLCSVGEALDVTTEVFDKNNNYTFCGWSNARKTEISSNAQIESRFQTKNGVIPASYRYQNQNGQRFLVFCFDAYFNDDGIYRMYERTQQLIEAVPYLSGKSLPAYSVGHPDLYMQTKQNGNRLAVALFNFCVDEIDAPVVTLQGKAKLYKAVNCTADIEGNTARLSCIAPFGAAFFEVELL